MRTIFKSLFLLILIIPCSLQASTLYPTEQENINVFKEVSPLVVNVQNIKRIRRTFDAINVPAGTGSGFIWSKTGHIVTNFHVIRGAKSVMISLQNGKSYKARIVGAEPLKDIAILKIDDKEALTHIGKLKPLHIGSSNNLQVGQRTVAIGNPYGLDQSMSVGIISALNRRIMGVAGVTIQGMIQTDAAINPGNSGGPLLDSHGELIGMNTMILSQSGSSSGIGFAVPVSEIKRIATQIIEKGRVLQPGIGIHLLGQNVSHYMGVKGVIIESVLKGGPAAKAGLRGTSRSPRGHLKLGDVIVDIDGKPVMNFDDLYNILDDKKIGQTVTLTIVRNDTKQKVKIKTFDLDTM